MKLLFIPQSLFGRILLGMGAIAAALLLAFFARDGSGPGPEETLVGIRKTRSEERTKGREIPDSGRVLSVKGDFSNHQDQPQSVESTMADQSGHASSQSVPDPVLPGPIQTHFPPAGVRRQLQGMDDQEQGSYHAMRIESAVASSTPPALPMVYSIAPERILAGNTHATPEVIDRLKDLFEKDAGVGAHPPNDPTAVEDWKAAEPTAADRMRTLFGWGAYGAFQREILEKKMREQGILGY